VQYFYIDNHEQLITLCQQLAQAKVLAVDTEFVRTRTLYPVLGLLQVSDGERVALIDPIVIEDLSPFWQIVEDPNILKVIHACSEDLEVFLNCGNCKPQNLLDSQIMMSFLGHGLSIGYAGMVKHYLDIDIDKSDSRTDWTKRPLSESQLVYARTDVEHLIAIYPKLAAELAESNWLAAAKQETQLLVDKKYSAIDVNSLYLNLKMAWSLNPKQLNALKYLAIWRYNEAVKKNRPLGFIAKDHTLIAVAQRNPKSVGAMLNIEGAEVLDVKHKGKAMLNVLKKASAVEPEEYPEKIRRLDDYPGYKQVFKRVKQFIAQKAEQHEQLTENFASKKQINQFLTWHYQHNNHADKQSTVDILNDWRFELFGNDLILSAKSNFAEL